MKHDPDDWQGEGKIRIGATVNKGFRVGAEKYCSRPGCERQLAPANTSGLCKEHYRTKMRRMGKAK